MGCVIGLDLSINSTGVCVRDVESGEVEYKIILPKLTKKQQRVIDKRISYFKYDKIEKDISSNINHISKKICDYIEDMRELKGSVDYVVIEDIAMSAKGRSLIDLSLLNGYIRCMLDGLSVRYNTIPPTQWKKKLLGNGQADKELIIYHWSRMDKDMYEKMKLWGVKMDDVADSYFLSLM